MIRHVVDRLATIVDEIVINCRRDQQEAIQRAIADVAVPTTIAIDTQPDEGPVAGMATGLAAADGTLATVVACDMPRVVPEFLEALFAIARGDHVIDPPSTPDAGPTPPTASPPYDAVVPLQNDGWYEPLQAVYRPQPMATACADPLDADQRKALAPLSRLSWTPVGQSVIDCYDAAPGFTSVDTRADLDRIAEAITTEM